MVLKEQIQDFFQNKSILLLGFGREGQSTYRFIRQYFPQKKITIADANSSIANHKLISNDTNVDFILGDYFLSKIAKFDLVFKSPGISFKNYKIPINQIITSQTDLFFRLFSEQTIGITGTKGKSTTVSLLKHILSAFGKDVLLIGNIGIPALDIASQISEQTFIIYELSSHQLEFVSSSPHISVLLNLYQEHLDHYNSFHDYRFAKWNILKYQNANDYFIHSVDEQQLTEDLSTIETKTKDCKFSISNTYSDICFVENKILLKNTKLFSFNKDKFPLLGQHNLNNLMASLLVCEALNMPISEAIEHSYSFRALPHRLEFVATKDGIKFYNDSIATIPQATIKALQSIYDVDTLVLGGFDRGIDYQVLIDYLTENKPINLLLIGKVGDFLFSELNSRNYSGRMQILDSFDDVIIIAKRITVKGKSCLLSPAASSYDSFKNFEERGDRFKELILSSLV